MKNLDRVVALAILVFSIVYAWQAFNYELLPFERNQPFKPNTMPIGLAVVAIVLSLAVLFWPARKDSSVLDESTVDMVAGEEEETKHYDKVRPVILVVLMILYALALRPLGFVGSTTGFLIISAMVLGERKFHVLVPIALVGAFFIWYVVQEMLGIYMNPWPAGLG
ncbi:MAG: tripartite tricarboxylate transporter TctB family protein [Pseudomonadota bacterium]|nr:tripartite tricarboxylate transporter TctB family protein [Pseudomonadota bacterium]